MIDVGGVYAKIVLNMEEWSKNLKKAEGDMEKLSQTLKNKGNDMEKIGKKMRLIDYL